MHAFDDVCVDAESVDEGDEPSIRAVIRGDGLGVGGRLRATQSASSMEQQDLCQTAAVPPGDASAVEVSMRYMVSHRRGPTKTVVLGTGIYRPSDLSIRAARPLADRCWEQRRAQPMHVRVARYPSAITGKSRFL